MTVRDYFRATGLNRAPTGSAGDTAGLGADAPPPPGAELAFGAPLSPEAMRNAAGESLERAVREGYLWCGSTFLLPPLFSLLVYAWHIISADTPPLSLFILLTFTTAVGCFLPVAFVRKVEVTGKLIAEMLGEMRPLAEAFPEDFARMSEWAKNNARLASSHSEESEELVEPRSAVQSVRRRRIGQ
jgi:hypothetical protein